MQLNILDIVIFFSGIVLRVFAISFSAFERYPLLDNYTCSDTSILFEVLGECRDSVQCLYLCKKMPQCFGLFYNSNSSVCTGCTEETDKGLGAEGIEPASGPTKFYFRKSRVHNSPCFHMSECGFLQYCSHFNVCTCQPGYSFHPSSGACVTSCAKYGKTYEIHLGFRIGGFDRYTFPSTLETCIFVCNNDEDCISFDFHLIYCMLKNATALTNPDAVEEAPGNAHFHRNCA